ncbi:hypothetical protein ACQ4PT_056411 [Festuca glaucescens]
MALQNIGASNKDDAFYRYKMPRMLTKIEGRGNGIKTNIVNMVDIAKALARPASYTTKYFGCELGAQSKFDEKTGISIVNGAHDTGKLAAILENFIKKYVQCANCRNPETEKGGKDKKAMRRAEKERLKEGAAADEEMKKLKKDAAKKKGCSSKENTVKRVTTRKKAGGGGGSSEEEHSTSPTHSGDAADEDDDDVQWQTDTSAEAARKRIAEQLSAATAEMVVLSTEETPYDELVEEIKSSLGNAATAAQLKAVLSSSTLPAKDVMNALFEALFHGAGKGFANDVKKNREYLAAAVPDEGAQILLLQAIGSFCSECSAEALKEVPVVLKVLYDGDVLEEETIVQWYDEAVAAGECSKAVENARRFVEWLQSAKSDEE